MAIGDAFRVRATVEIGANDTSILLEGDLVVVRVVLVDRPVMAE
jgi:hypothetical protein